MEQNNKTQSKIVETYAEDMAKIIEDDKTGLIKKIIHEEEEHEKVNQNLSPESKRNQIFLFVGLLLIFFGLITLFYFISLDKSPIISIEKSFTPLIFNDKSAFLEVGGFKREEVIQTIFNQVHQTEVKKGGVDI
jgi:hypothetical protein